MEAMEASTYTPTVETSMYQCTCKLPLTCIEVNVYFHQLRSIPTDCHGSFHESKCAAMEVNIPRCKRPWKLTEISENSHGSRSEFFSSEIMWWALQSSPFCRHLFVLKSRRGLHLRPPFTAMGVHYGLYVRP